MSAREGRRYCALRYQTRGTGLVCFGSRRSQKLLSSSGNLNVIAARTVVATCILAAAALLVKADGRSATVRISDDPGGRIGDYVVRYQALRAAAWRGLIGPPSERLSSVSEPSVSKPLAANSPAAVCQKRTFG